MSPTSELEPGNIGYLVFQGDQCALCVCVCVCVYVLFFRAKLSSLAYFVVLWEERHHLV